MISEGQIIRDVRLIDGNGTAQATGQSVVIEAVKISWIGPTGSEPAFAAERVIDAGGRTLLVGLSNAHVHLTHDGAPDLFAQVPNDSIPIVTPRAARNARLTQESGVTTVRDCVYEHTSTRTEVFELDGGLVLRATCPAPLIENDEENLSYEYTLQPVTDDLFVLRPPQTVGWTAVTFYCLDDGTPCVHYGVRANPKCS